MTYKERHAPNTTPPLPEWRAPQRDEVIPESCGCPLPKMPGTSFCYDHGQNAMLALDAKAVRLYNAQQELTRRSDLLKQAIFVHRGGLTRLAPAETREKKPPSPNALRLQAIIDAAIKG